MRAHAVGVLQGLGHHLLQLSLSRAVAVVREQVLTGLVGGPRTERSSGQRPGPSRCHARGRCSPARGPGSWGRRGCAYSRHRRGSPGTSAVGWAGTRSTLLPGGWRCLGALLPMQSTDGGELGRAAPRRKATTIGAVVTMTARKRPCPSFTVTWHPRPWYRVRVPIGPPDQGRGGRRSRPIYVRGTSGVVMPSGSRRCSGSTTCVTVLYKNAGRLSWLPVLQIVTTIPTRTRKCVKRLGQSR